MSDENDNSYFNPLGRYEEEYCNRACAELFIYPGVMSPLDVTSLLGIQPTNCVVIGEEQATEPGRYKKVNGWVLSSESYIKSTDMIRHVDWLIEQLKNCVQALKQLQNTDGVKMYVVCIWWVNLDGGGPILRPKQMRALADLNLECAFDFQYYGLDFEGRIPGIIYEPNEEDVEVEVDMNIRKSWNLWGIVLLPIGFFLFGFIGLGFNVLGFNGEMAIIMAFLWLAFSMYMHQKKCRCPKCHYLLKSFDFEELSMFTCYYWRSGVKLKCKRCGQALN